MDNLTNTTNPGDVTTTTTTPDVTTTSTTIAKTEAEIRAEIIAELDKDKQREIDRRVTDAVKKKEVEAEKKAILDKMSAEDRANELLKQKDEEISKYKREKEEITLKDTLRDTLKEIGLDDSLKDTFHISKYTGVENGVESMKEDAKKLKETFDTALNKRFEDFKSEYLKGTTPDSVNADKKTLSELDRAKMSGKTINMIMAKLNAKN